ncbi:hypothetical protein BS17DRAFT_321592 [Gyrodon lividus]|nr:hypothetical protein BS17DRAFT_321592 [Gyrodon lividus]
MPRSDPSPVIRIAIALAALKHKPRDQSIAYLQSHFPLLRSQAQNEPGDDENCSGQSAAASNDTEKWRTHALGLEKDLATLKAQRDADQELLFKLRADASQAKTGTSDAPPPKKKSKKSTSKDPQAPEWNWDQSRADWSGFLHSQHPPPPSLVEAYTSLKGALSSSNEDKESYASRLTDAIRRAFETIYVFVFSAGQTYPSPNSPVRAKTEDLDSARIAMASPFLMYVLRTALPSLVRTTPEPKHRRALHAGSGYDAHIYVNKVTNHLLESVLLPLLRSFVPVCNTRLAALLTAKKAGARDKGKGKEKHTGKTPSFAPSKLADTRTDLLALLGVSLAALDALPSYLGPSSNSSIGAGIRSRLGLETIRELEALYAGPSSPSSQLQAPSQSHARSSQPITATQSEKRAKRLERLAGTREERISALAVKDAAWYLASALNLCVSQSAGKNENVADGMGKQSSQLLRDALVDRIGKLVRSVTYLGFEDVEEINSNGDARPQNPEYTVDPVCRSILLAVCEHAMSEFSQV